MLSYALLPAALALTLALSSPAPVMAEPPAKERDAIPMETVRTDDARMNAAIAQARRTLPKFLALLADPPPGTGEFTFKYPLGGWEHIWVDQVERRGAMLTGRLANHPEQDGYRRGQRVTVPLSAVSDWAYRDAGGVVRGHYTTRVLLPRMDPADARSVREDMGWSR